MMARHVTVFPSMLAVCAVVMVFPLMLVKTPLIRSIVTTIPRPAGIVTTFASMT
jgi:hypothetical protein